MLKPVDITLAKCEEDTDKADVFEDDTWNVLSRGMSFPTIWHFDKWRLRRASAASF